MVSSPKLLICRLCSNEALFKSLLHALRQTNATMDSLHVFITPVILIFILTLICAFAFWLIRRSKSKSSYELTVAVIQNKQLPQPEFYV
uniref:Uncharacterized protein n=1 Tax=Onchocerca volvulus TaxID=6282 RepID=A0A2K6WJ00_ONCVO